MLITKKLEKELRESEAIILLDDGKDTAGQPRLVLRQVQGTWGDCDRFKGGVCFAPLSDGSDHIRYESVLGYNTGRRASVQALLLLEGTYRTNLKRIGEEWGPFLQSTTEMLLNAKPLVNLQLTVKALTTPRYWYCDNWAGHRHAFISLRDAKVYAKHETGMSVAIHACGTGDLICFAPASGYCPP